MGVLSGREKGRSCSSGGNFICRDPEEGPGLVGEKTALVWGCGGIDGDGAINGEGTDFTRTLEALEEIFLIQV